MVVITGAYTVDLDATFEASLLRMGFVAGAITLLAVWLVNRDIAGSLLESGGRRHAHRCNCASTRRRC
jgi:hypothetical protein